jgi:hypothetical protein
MARKKLQMPIYSKTRAQLRARLEDAKKQSLELARSTVASRPKELLHILDPKMLREAYSNGMNFSTYLETLDPSHEHEGNFKQLDAFQRLLVVMGIRSESVHGVAASTFEDLVEASVDDYSGSNRVEVGKILAQEWLARTYRKAVNTKTQDERAVYLSGDNAVGSSVNPFAYAMQIRYPRLEPAIPLSALIAFETGITSDTYRAYYIAQNTSHMHMVRVTEASEIPRAKLVGGDQDIRLTKFGRGLEVSYEQLRRLTLDRIAFHLQWLAFQAEADKVAVAIDVLVSGDGNANTAATSFNLTALDSSTTANNLTFDAWLAFRMKFLAPYVMTTILAQDSVAVKLMKLNLGSANIPYLMMLPELAQGGFDNINPTLRNRVALGWTSDAPASKIVGFDSRWALERVYEIGATVQELDRFIANQTELITLTETEGYKIFDQAATKVMNLAA